MVIEEAHKNCERIRCSFKDPLRDLNKRYLLYLLQTRPQGLLAFQNGGGSGEDPGTQQITCLQRGWRCIQNGGYREKGEKNWVRDAKVKITKMAEKAEVQFKKK